MRVRVRAFAALREALGFTERLLTLPEGATAADAIERLSAEHPTAGLVDRRFAVAVNRAYAGRQAALADGDELALIPPVSGGAGRPFEIVDGPISLDEVAQRVLAPERGGVTLFAGVVRGVTGAQQTDHLEYEAYAEMAEPVFAAIAAEAQARWPAISAVAVVHRVGRLEVGDVSIAIAVAAAHRADTFDACHYIIDRVKQAAPIWKREIGPDGSAWVEGPESTITD
ncbi:MAG: Molybdopterin synthase catalytic subunit [Chloroflexi bacterium ADurb.Bin325]|nr:MAG: Molybdopterin synthase catalytic subunit [Chloroflexi bacterium ADurb.Bin325]